MTESIPSMGLAWFDYLILWGAWPKSFIEGHHSDIVFTADLDKVGSRSVPAGTFNAESDRSDVHFVLLIPTDS